MADALQHHRYSASGAEGWRVCAGKLVMEDGCADTSSDSADMGSVAHYLAAYCLQNALPARTYLGEKVHCWSLAGERDGQSFAFEMIPKEAVIRSSWPVTEEMADYVQGYVDFVTKAAEGKELMVEQRVHFGSAIGLEGAFGTTDAAIVAYDASTVHIVDLKYGYGEVKAAENPQMMLYAAGVLEDLSILYDFRNLRAITQTIYQPRIDNISSWTYTPEDLKGFLTNTQAAIQRAEEARAFFHVPNIQFQTREEWAAEYLQPSEKGCKWCKRRGDCPALAAEMVSPFIEATSDGFTDLDMAESPKALLASPVADFNAQIDAAIAAVPTLPFETVAKIFGAIRRFEDWIKAIESRMLQGLLEGETHPDYKLVQGKQGNRKWASEEEAEAVMKAMRLKLDEMYEKSIISPTTAEKLLKSRPKAWAKLQPLITRSEGKPSVAPSSDKRPAIEVGHPLDGFEALPEIDAVPETSVTADEFDFI